MNHIYIHKGNSQVNFYLSTYDGENGYINRGYYGYSVREALKLFRACAGLRYKHCKVIDYRV